MRNRVVAILIAGLAAGLAAQPAQALGLGGGAWGGPRDLGGHAKGAGDPIFPSRPPFPDGKPAYVPVEVTDAPVGAAEGRLKRGQVIAWHELRASDAVVLLEPVRGVPAGTALARVSLRSSSGDQPVWCDVRPNHLPLLGFRHDCFQDANGDGKLDRLWVGESPAHFLGWGASGLKAKGALPAPVAYRAARPDERPRTLLGYRFCDGDGVSGPPRFALAVTRPGKTRSWSMVGTCMFGAWPGQAHTSKVDVDALRLTTTADAGGLRFKVERRLPTGPIAELDPTRPLAFLAPAAPVPDDTVPDAEAAEPSRPEAFVPLGPIVAATSVIRAGQTIFTVPVRHGVTGVLQNRIRPGIMLRPDKAVGVGQPVYGIPLGDARIVWCAPRRKPGRSAYDTACFIPMGAGYVWMPHRTPAMYPGNLTHLIMEGRTSSVPTVDRGPVDLPPMVLSFQLRDVKPDPHPARPAGQIFDIDVSLDWGEGPKQVSRTDLQIGPAGRRLLAPGGSVLVKPGAGPGELVASVDPPPVRASLGP